MYRKMIFTLCLILFSVVVVVAEESGPSAANGPNPPNGPGEPDARTVKGMSVLGNNEAPMSLFIVPWKGSDLGVETNLTRTLNERDVPVDRDVFMRELDFYQVSVGGKAAAPAAVAKIVK